MSEAMELKGRIFVLQKEIERLEGQTREILQAVSVHTYWVTKNPELVGRLREQGFVINEN